jgi:8-oxo-dGTP pyrophosphatase MutT (NUDIX family)
MCWQHATGMLRVVSSQVRYENPWLRVREDVFVRPDGTQGVFGVVERRDFACIVPWDGTHLWLVEQYRHPVGAWSLELPQGGWDPGDPGGTPEELARLELREETGCRAGSMTHLGRLWQGVGVSNQSYDVWLATGLEEGEADPGIDEHGPACRAHDARRGRRGGRRRAAARLGLRGVAALLARRGGPARLTWRRPS